MNELICDPHRNTRPRICGSHVRCRWNIWEPITARNPFTSADLILESALLTLNYSSEITLKWPFQKPGEEAFTRDFSMAATNPKPNCMQMFIAVGMLKAQICVVHLSSIISVLNKIYKAENFNLTRLELAYSPRCVHTSWTGSNVLNCVGKLRLFVRS